MSEPFSPFVYAYHKGYKDALEQLEQLLAQREQTPELTWLRHTMRLVVQDIIIDELESQFHEH